MKYKWEMIEIRESGKYYIPSEFNVIKVTLGPMLRKLLSIELNPAFGEINSVETKFLKVEDINWKNFPTMCTRQQLE